MKAAVTGANGFIGRNLVKGLIQEGHEVLSIVRRADKGAMLSRLGSDVAVLDLEQIGRLRDSLQGKDTLFHLANVMVFATKREQWRTNVLNTGNVLRTASAAGVHRFVYASSAAVYGDTGNGWANEESQKRPTTHYGKTKVVAEELIKKEAADLCWQVLRPGVVYGPGSPLLFHTARRGPILLNRGSGWVPLVHVVDVVRALMEASAREVSGGVFNVVDDRPIQLADFLKLIAKEAGVPLRRGSYTGAFLLALAAESSAYLTRGVPRLTRDALRLFRSSARVSNRRVKEELGFRFLHPDPLKALPEAVARVSEPFA